MLALRHLVPALVLAGSATAQLAGVYTINPMWPAMPSNYPSLAAATADLLAQGVVGPVWFDVYDDAGPYTEQFPFITANVQYAPSDAGLVFAQWNGVSSTNRVTFQAALGESPVIDAAGRGFGVWWNGADYVTLKGFEIKNAVYDAVSFYSEATVGQVFDAEVDGCRIHDCGGAGVCIYGNSPNPTNTLIQNCFFWHLQTTNAGGFSTTARFGYISTRRAVNTRVIANTFFLDSGTGGSFCALGSYTSSTAEVTFGEVSNNVFLKTTGASYPIYRWQTVSGATYPFPLVMDANCYFDAVGTTFALYGVSAGTTAANFAAWQAASALDATSINQDPALLDPLSGDLHLTAASPCLAVLAMPSNPAVDIDNQPRVPIGIGADQFSSAMMRQVGSGCAGSNGTSALYSRQWPFLGNQGFALLSNGAPVAAVNFAVMSFGVNNTPIPFGGCNIYLAPGSLTLFGGVVFAGPVGNVGRLLALPANGNLAGTNLTIQELFLDSGTPLGMTLTNGLEITLGF